VFLYYKNSFRSLLHPVGRKRIVEDMISEETQIKHKGGRPKKPVHRKVTSLRLSKAELFIIRSKAENAGMSMTTYIRQMAIHGKVIAKMDEEEKQFARQLVGMANNLNQLTKKAHQEGLLTAVLFFEKYSGLFDEFLKRMKHD
jgi:predicted DNA binding CopG/RHH family protein